MKREKEVKLQTYKSTSSNRKAFEIALISKIKEETDLREILLKNSDSKKDILPNNNFCV